jgi:hypothetical protein
MAWESIKIERRQGTGGGRPAFPVRVSLHPNGSRAKYKSCSLRFAMIPEVIERAVLRVATGVHLEVDSSARMLRLNFRVSGPCRLRPVKNWRSWMMSCIHSGRMVELFPDSMFVRQKLWELKLIEASSEAITLELPALEGGAQ